MSTETRQKLHPVQALKIKMSLDRAQHLGRGKRAESIREQGRNLLASWESHAKEAGFPSLDAWLAFSEPSK